MGAPVRTQDLFSAETGSLAAFKGSDRTWRTFSTGVGSAIVVANGPLWGDGDKVWRSADYLLSPALSSVPAAGVNVTSIWTELDLDADAVAAGLVNGKVAFSSDAGATWIVKDGPDEPNPVLKVILSRFHPGQVHVITSGGFWQSPDAGETWGIVRAGDYRDLDENQFRSWAIEVTGGTGAMIEATSGAAITGSGADNLVAVTSHILADRGYAAAADGSFYLLASDGATALTAGTAVPAGTPQHRGLHRTAAPDIVLAAVGSGGIVKTTDGGRATWWFLRKPSVAGAGAGPFTQIGAGLLQSLTTPSGLRVYVLGFDTTLVYRSTNGGANFSALSVPAGFTGPSVLGFDVLSVAGGNDIVWCGDNDGHVAKSTDAGSTWTEYNISALTGFSTNNIVIIDAQTVFVGGSTAVAVTTDGGSSWSAFTPTDIRAPISGIPGGSKLWTSSAASHGTVKHRYNLDGSGAETLTHGSPSTTGLTAASDTLAFVLQSATDGQLKKIDGVTITSIPTGSALDATDSYYAAYAPADGSYYLAWIVNQLWRTTTGGPPWTMVESDAAMEFSGGSPHQGLIRSAPADPTKVFLAANALSSDVSVWYSSDSGVTWAIVGTIAGEQDAGPIRVASG
jgi:hypothetical protein